MHSESQLRQALAMWLELSEVDPCAKSFRISLGGGMDDYTVKTMHDAIKEALDLDHSNITGHLMLDAMSSIYFENRSFSVADLMANPERTQAYIEKAKQFTLLARSPEIKAETEAFVSQLRRALSQYDLATPENLEFLNKTHELAYLRRDALRSIQKLRVDQFLSGASESFGTPPVYNAWVHQFWNVNNLVEAACRLPAGVTLNLIRDPDDMQSYFAFTIRNGGNLYLLSDVPVHAHPLQKYMARRPDRDFDRRTAQNWFPYDLLKLVYDENAKAFFADEVARRGLVPIQQTVDKVRHLSDLQPAETIWLVMMFDLIVDKFWHKGHQAPSLSYTGQMISEELPLVTAAEKANLPVASYPTLALAPLTLADVRRSGLKAGAIGSDGGSPNNWLEDRYAEQVRPDVFNVLDGGSTKFYLLPNPEKQYTGRTHKNHPLATVDGEMVSVLRKEDAKLADWDKEGRYTLQALPTTSFGTREELENNRLYLARYNMAQAIQKLADAEYANRAEDIKAWWKAALQNNIEHLRMLAAQGTVIRQAARKEGVPTRLRTCDGWYVDTLRFNFAKVHTDETWPKLACMMTALHGGYRNHRDHFLCYLNETASTYRVLFQPQSPEDLAELAGCSVADLPDVLQHWSPSRDHEGNHLLSRIDPMAWALDDPWTKLTFQSVLYLSKRALAQCQKDYPLEA